MEWPGPSAVNVIQPSAPSGSTRARPSPMVMDTAEWSAASAGPIRCLSKVICQSNVIPGGSPDGLRLGADPLHQRVCNAGRHHHVDGNRRNGRLTRKTQKERRTQEDHEEVL